MEPLWRARRWPEPGELVELVGELGVPPVIAAALAARGLGRAEELRPPLRPWRYPGLERAARVVAAAVREGKRIRVHGDYDADGITGTALLVRGLSRVGGRVHPFIPTREEGYGVSPERLADHAAAADLFITVDSGITNHAELKSLVEDGVNVVVTDHHHPKGGPPPGEVVHPAFDPAFEGKPKPTGAGVAYFLLWRVYELLGEPAPEDLLDLAAVGTVADVAPLLGVNRAIVREGLERIKDSTTLGLRFLAERLMRRANVEEVAFRVAPRINAAGRLGEPDTALRLLLTDDPAEAAELVARLDRLNVERQRIEEEMLDRVLPALDPGDPAHVVHDPEGHPGVMGIVAGRILERTGKPVFIVVGEKGSVRSPPGVSAVAALASAADLLTGYGGHAQAAGFSIPEERIPEFRRRIHRYVRDHPPPPPELWLDGPVFRDELPELFQALSVMEPLGEGNPPPLFHLRGRPERPRELSGGRHLSFHLAGMRVLFWRAGDRELPGELELAAGVTASEWNGEETLELVAEAVRAPREVLGAGEPVEVRRLGLREALELVLTRGIPGYAEGEGARWLRERGGRLAPPEEAEVWLAVPGRPVAARPVALALGERALMDLVRPRVSRAALARARGEPRPPPPYDRILAELGGEENPYRSPTYRRLAVVTAYGRRLAWAYRVGDEALLGEALVGYLHALAQLEAPPD